MEYHHWVQAVHEGVGVDYENLGVGFGHIGSLEVAAKHLAVYQLDSNEEVGLTCD